MYWIPSQHNNQFVCERFDAGHARCCKQVGSAIQPKMKLDGVQAAEKIRSLRKTTAGSIHVMALAAGKQKERYLFFQIATNAFAFHCHDDDDDDDDDDDADDDDDHYYDLLSLYIISSICFFCYMSLSLDVIPVVPHKAVAEVSRIGNYRRDWLL